MIQTVIAHNIFPHSHAELSAWIAQARNEGWRVISHSWIMIENPDRLDPNAEPELHAWSVLMERDLEVPEGSPQFRSWDQEDQTLVEAEKRKKKKGDSAPQGLLPEAGLITSWPA